MNRLVYLILIIILLSNCSFNKNNKFWSISKKIDQKNNLEKTKKKVEKISTDEEIFAKELNQNLKIKIQNIFDNKSYKFTNNSRINFDAKLEKTSRYKFSKIKNFYQYDPTISFQDKNIIFFENKGSILKFNENSKLIWKKNYYSKNEKKLNPILQFANNKNFLIVADNISKYYKLDINSGELIWSKTNLAPFNSQIKIYKDKFLIIDFSNTLRCFSLKNGMELWNVKTQNSLIRSQKKLSMVIIEDKVYFNNSVGDISGVDLNNGELLWQLPTQSSLIFDSSFSLENSDLISNKKTLFFSNNKNRFFSVDISTGSLNWQNKINSNLRPTLINNILYTISLEGFLFLIDSNTGNIIRVTDVFNVFKLKKRNIIKPTGYIIGASKIYLSTNNGKIIKINIKDGNLDLVHRVSRNKISKPYVNNSKLYIIKNNGIIKIN